jgi:exodeoxyribonuclease III
VAGESSCRFESGLRHHDSINARPATRSGFFVEINALFPGQSAFQKVNAMSETIKLLSWNVNGIRAAYKKGFLDWLAHVSPDILCVQETKAQPEQLSKNLLEPEGYHVYWSSAEKKGYSGVAIYTKQEPLLVQTGMGIPKFDVEGRVVRADYSEFTLFNVYFPNGKQNQQRLDYKMEFYDAFLDELEKLRKEKRRIVFCGDVNTAHKEIDLARPKENAKGSGFLPIEREWIDKVVDLGYVDTFRLFNSEPDQYSWWDLRTRARERNKGWRIDYVFATREMLDSVKTGFILQDVMGSDHCPVGIELDFG